MKEVGRRRGNVGKGNFYKDKQDKTQGIYAMTRNVQQLFNKRKHKRDRGKSVKVDKQRVTSQLEKPINRGSVEA